MSDYFQDRAHTWEDNPQVIDSAERFTRELEKHFTVDSGHSLMEFGCGTGLVGLRFADRARSLAMIDQSPSMLSVLKKKVELGKHENVTVLEGNMLEMEHGLSGIDLIFSLMTLHHVKNIHEVIGEFHRVLREDGTVIVADLVKEDGSFHGGDNIEHHGFNPIELERLFEEKYFSVVSNHVYNTIQKAGDDGRVTDYDQFILIAVKG